MILSGHDSLAPALPPQVRPATLADSSAAARLAAEWGYPTTADHARRRLDALLASPNHLALVAEIGGAPVGWATAEMRLSLGSDPRVEITGLVVSSAHRRIGAGRRLVTGIERWAAEKGCHEIFLRSNVNRPEAHPFYAELGYERIKTQHAYRRALQAIYGPAADPGT